MVYRVYVEKRAELAHEAASLRDELTTFLGIKGLENVRLFNRYDAENIEKEVFDGCIATVFSEPQLDIVSFELPTDARAVFAVEFLPGYSGLTLGVFQMAAANGQIMGKHRQTSLYHRITVLQESQ